MTAERTDDELLAALIEDPDALDAAAWERARAIAAVDPERLRRHLRMDDLLGRVLDPTRADLLAAIRHRLDHPVASARFASAVMRRRSTQTSTWRSLAQLAVAAVLAIAAGIWWLTAPAPAPTAARAAICRVDSGGGEVRHAQSSALLAVGDMLAGDDAITAAAVGATLRYDDGTTLVLAAGAQLRLLTPDARAGKRARLEGGTLAAEVAPQAPGHPLIIATPEAEVMVIGTAFTLAARDGRTRLEVTHGRVRLTRTADAAAVEVGAGDAAVVAPGVALAAVPIAESTTLLFRDFEDGPLSADSLGTLVDGPPRDGNRRCVAAIPIAEPKLARVMLTDADSGLFTYRPGAELSFDYWVDDRVVALAVYVWNRTQQVSCGGFELYAPELAKQRWSHAVVRLGDLHTGASSLRDGDLVTEVTIQNAESGALFIDNIRVTAPPAK